MAAAGWGPRFNLQQFLRAATVPPAQEAILREQLKAIKKELGDTADEAEELVTAGA